MSPTAEPKHQYLFLVEFDSKNFVRHKKFWSLEPGIPAKVVVAQF